MTVKNKKRGIFGNSKELDLGKNEELIKLFTEYLRKNFEKSSTEFLDSIKKEKLSVPDSIFNDKLTVLETIVKYLKENLNFNYKEIADLINRDERNIWHTYNVARKKLAKQFVVEKYEFLIPISIFSNRKLSIQENLVFYLKEEFKLSYHKIATLIHRDDRTIWTVYQKAKKKYGTK